MINENITGLVDHSELWPMSYSKLASNSDQWSCRARMGMNERLLRQIDLAINVAPNCGSGCAVVMFAGVSGS